MKYIIRYLSVIFIMTVSGCSGKHLIEKKEYRDAAGLKARILLKQS